LASRYGAVVTTEHVVTADVIRAHSHLVRLPDSHVRHVCEVPFGAHPGPFGSAVTPEFRQYEEDGPFYGEYFAAVKAKEPHALASWVREWIIGLDHPGYLAALGSERLVALAGPVAVRGLEPLPGPPATDGVPPSDNELVMVLATRALTAKVEQSRRRVMLVGVGLSEVPALAAYEQLTSVVEDLRLAMGHGFYGFEPVPGRSEPDATTSLMTTDTFGIYGTELAHPDRPGLAILGAAQVDRRGNMNSTVVDGKLLTGSGGSNDASSVCETVVVTRLSPDRLVAEVEYVTCPGTNVSTVITERGVFEKRGGAELVLTSYVQQAGESRDEVLSDIEKRCGWKVEVAPDASRATLPEQAELALIRKYLPSRYKAGSQPDRK
jgi:acyl CoA:acetate/3-ketoacid CoA transferase beta subunit